MNRRMRILLPVGTAGVALGGIAMVFVASLFVSADDIAARMPCGTAARAAFALLLFALQGIVPFLMYGPIVIACGLLFDRAVAIPLCVIGTALAITVPYLIGRLAPAAWVRARLERHPRLLRFTGGEAEASFLFSYFLRAVGLSNKALGLFFGLSRMRFVSFLAASLLGTAPSMAGYLLLGQSWGVGAPFMWVAFLGNMLIVSALTFLYRRRERRAFRQMR